MPKSTVAGYLSGWLLARSTSIAPRTIECYNSLITLHIAPQIGQKSLHKLKARHIQKMLAALVAEGHTRTAELCFVLLRLALKDTEARHVMEDIPRPLHRARPASWWSPDELRAYLAESSGQWRLCWLLALCCGLRRGELAGLRWTDVDLNAGIIRIRNQRQFVKGRGVIDGPPKSASGIRDLPIPAHLVEELTAAKLLHDADALIGSASPYVLTGHSGAGLSPSSIDQAHRRQLSRSGVRPIPLHGMRHTMATLAIALGVDIRVVQSVLGHAQVTTTAHVYAHVVTSAQRTAIDAVTQAVIH